MCKFSCTAPGRPSVCVFVVDLFTVDGTVGDRALASCGWIFAVAVGHFTFGWGAIISRPYPTFFVTFSIIYKLKSYTICHCRCRRHTRRRTSSKANNARRHRAGIEKALNGHLIIGANGWNWANTRCRHPRIDGPLARSVHTAYI